MSDLKQGLGLAVRAASHVAARTAGPKRTKRARRVIRVHRVERAAGRTVVHVAARTQKAVAPKKAAAPHGPSKRRTAKRAARSTKATAGLAASIVGNTAESTAGRLTSPKKPKGLVIIRHGQARALKNKTLSYYDTKGRRHSLETVPFKAQRSGLDAFVMDKVRPAVIAPAVKALKIAAIPNHLIARNVDKLISGKDPGKNATFSDVLKDAGVKNKAVRGVAGFGLDVATDPTTYLTAGTSTAARKAALKGAGKTIEKSNDKVLSHLGEATRAARAGNEKAAAKALKTGTRQEQRLKKAQAVANAEDRQPTRGITVGVRVHAPFTDKTLERQTSGRATAAVARKVKHSKASRKASEANAHVRTALSHTVAPDVTPGFRSRAEHEQIRAAERRARAQQGTGERQIARRVKALNRAATPEEHRVAVAQLETGLADHLQGKFRQVAQTYEREHARQLAVKQERGLLKTPFRPSEPGDAKVYFPHVNAKTVGKEGKVEGQFSVKAAKEKRRTIPGTLEDISKDKPGLFVEHGPTAHGAKSIQNLRQQVRSDLWRAVADTGRPLTREADVSTDEMVYRVTPHGLTPLATDARGRSLDREAVVKAAQDKQGEYVILNRKSVEKVQEPRAVQSEHLFGKVVDRATGAIKRVDTKYNPSFQPRNLMGDSILAYQADTTVKSGAQAFRAMLALHSRNAAESSTEAVLGAGGKTAKAEKLLDRPVKGVTVDGHPVTYGEAIVAAEEHGAINTGFVGQELRDLLGGARVKKGIVLTKTGPKVKEKVKTGSGGSTVSSINEYRENMPRFASFIQALKAGKNFDEAAQHSLKSHIDYGDLSHVEQSFNRRAFPFYTFFARNTRIQMTTLLRRPGKLSTVAHAYDEISKAAGFQSYQDYVGTLPDSQQRGLPIPVRVGKSIYPIFLSPPQTDLNQATVSPSTQLQNVANRLSFFKAIPEVLLNYSIFFQGPIKDPDHPRVPAPRGIEKLPTPIRNLLGVRPIYVHGKKVWGWYAKADYISRTLPQSNFAVSSAKPSPDDRGLNGWVALASFVTGVRVAPDKTLNNQINAMTKASIDLDHRIKALRQSLPRDSQGHYVDSSEVNRLQAKKKIIDKQIGPLRVRRGDPSNVIPPTQKAAGAGGDDFSKFLKSQQGAGGPDEFQKFLQSQGR